MLCGAGFLGALAAVEWDALLSSGTPATVKWAIVDILWTSCRRSWNKAPRAHAPRARRAVPSLQKQKKHGTFHKTSIQIEFREEAALFPPLYSGGNNQLPPKSTFRKCKFRGGLPPRTFFDTCSRQGEHGWSWQGQGGCAIAATVSASIAA